MTGIVDEAREALLDAVSPLLNYESPAKYESRKIIHDPIWGTTRLETWEAALLDIPIFQRLRGIKQTGFSHFTYPSAEHSRFQHTLGVVHAASRTLQSLSERRNEGGITRSPGEVELRLKETLDNSRTQVLLRLTALVHDLGHSFYSHTSERIFSLVDPFPTLIDELKSNLVPKRPGAAEVVVYLLVTSEEWQEVANRAWRTATRKTDPPSPEEWKQVGLWVMGHEPDHERKFLSDIISGPIDADKLDYIARDAYSAGLPITYDLDRFIATVTIDYQNGRLRLTIPARGINALEQLVMSRLVLNSYLYHHQKVRAAEATLERILVREWLKDGTILDTEPPWPMFAMEDADLYSYGSENPSGSMMQLVRRHLPVRLAEFRRWTLEESDSEAVTSAYTNLLADETTRHKASYERRLSLEDELAEAGGLNSGDVIVDVPRSPSYSELEDLKIPRTGSGPAVTPREILDYHRWINAYQAHRSYIRIFCPREAASDREVWSGIKTALHDNKIPIPDGAWRYG